MTGRFTSAIRTLLTLGLLCVLGGHALWLNAQVTAIESDHCAAGPDADYFTPLNSTGEATSELCFTRLGEINGTAGEYLYIDVASRSQTSDSSSDAILLPAWQVKAKPYLKKKPLLITAEPYKRHELAKLCHDLIQSGFQNPKILLGNIPKSDADRQGFIAPVDEFIVEVSNFGAVTVATNQKVADALTSLGIPAVAAGEGADLKSAIRNAEVSYSLNGYLPVFVVGEGNTDKDLAQLLSKHPVTRAFAVSGGIEAIKTSLKTIALSSVKRLTKHGVPGCAG